MTREELIKEIEDNNKILLSKLDDEDLEKLLNESRKSLKRIESIERIVKNLEKLMD